jgi:mono/diheme cytochrome c family protein
MQMSTMRHRRPVTACRTALRLSWIAVVTAASYSCAKGDTKTAGGAVDTTTAPAASVATPTDTQRTTDSVQAATTASSPNASGTTAQTGTAAKSATTAPTTATTKTATAKTATTKPAATKTAATPSTHSDSGVTRAAATPSTGPATSTAASSTGGSATGTSTSSSVGATKTVAQGADSLLVSQDEYNGWKTFHVYCYRCHGVEAMGSDIAPNLRESLKTHITHDLFIETVTNGRLDKGMPSWKELLTRDKMEELYAYLKARSEGRLKPGRPHTTPKS